MTILKVPVTSGDHAQGSESAEVTLVEYGDYECPHCGRAYPIVQGIQKHFGKRLRFVFRNFPLSQVHPHAQKAAEVAEEAADQNKFWNMHDYLYEHQQALDDMHLEKYAKIVGLDLERFDEDMMTHVYVSRIREDFLSGIQNGVNGTSSFYIRNSK